LIERLRRQLGLGRDPGSAEILERLRQMAERMELAPAAAPPPAPRPEPVSAPPVMLRGILATEPRVFEVVRRRRSRSDRLGDWMTRLFALATTFNLALVLLILGLALWGVWHEPPEPDHFVVGMSVGQSIAVSAKTETGQDSKKVEAEKGPDPKEEPEKEKAVEEPQPEKPAENPADRTEAPSQAGKAEPVNSNRVTELPTFNEAEYAELLATMIPSVGAGASGVPPPPPPKELGQLIQKDPTEATLKARRQELAALSGGTPGDLIVVRGEYDEVQRILRRFEIPFSTVGADELGTIDLTGALAVVVNCDQAFAARERAEVSEETLRRLRKLREEAGALEPRAATEEQRRRLAELRRQIDAAADSIDRRRKPDGAALNLRRFVARGGYLMTSDWAVTLLEQAFPGTVAFADKTGAVHTAMTIPPQARDNPLLRLSLMGSDTRSIKTRALIWEVDGGSYLFTTDESQVTLLARGDALKRHGALAVTFRPIPADEPGRSGRVLHVLSHIKKQADKYGDYALQNVLINFLIERASRGR
jgi:hypothetical protein